MECNDSNEDLTTATHDPDMDAVRDSATLLEAILDNIGSQIYVKDLDGRYLLANRQVAIESGIAHSDMIGHTDLELFPESNTDTWSNNDQTVLDTKERLEYEEAFDTPAGKQIYLSQKFPLVDEDGTAYALGGISTNITERKRAEIAIQTANQAKSDFLSRMSHELRTPLNAILGFAQVLERDDLSIDQRDSVKQILQGGQHLLNLINEVLDIARIETGRLAISLEDVDTDDVIQEVMDLMRPLAEHRSITIAVGAPLASGDYAVRADRQRLKQVLLNLVSNAVKYTPDRGDVTITCDEPDSGLLAIRVADTGAGIAPDNFAMLFEPFERLGADASAVEGSGLGLALAKGLTEAMHGAIEVESAINVGSTFSIILQKAEEHHALVSGDGRQAHPVDSDPTVGRFLVLHIEDNVANLRLVEEVLRQRPNIDIVASMTGQLGIELAAEHLPALIVLDLHLPDMHGSEVLQRLQRDAHTRDIPVMVLSADASKTEERRIKAHGARAYLTKPLELAVFLDAIDALLSASDFT